MLSLGPLGQEIEKAIPETRSPEAFGHYDFRFAKPLDTELLGQICEKYQHLVTVEDGCLAGGFGGAVLEYLADAQSLIPVTRLGIPDAFIHQGTPEELYKETGLDREGLRNTLNNLLNA